MNMKSEIRKSEARKTMSFVLFVVMVFAMLSLESRAIDTSVEPMPTTVVAATD